MVISLTIFGILFIKQVLEIHKLNIWHKGWKFYKTEIKFTKLFLQYICLCIGIITLCIYLQLENSTLLLLVMNILLGFILVMDWSIKFYQNEAAFNETTLFMTHISSFFKVNGKIQQSLYECKAMMDSSNWIEDIIQEIKVGTTITNCAIPLPKHYLLTSILTLLETAESYGSDMTQTNLEYLDYDVDRLVEQTHYDIEERNKLRQKLMMLIILTIGVALTSYWLLNGVVEITKLSLYQGIMSAFFQSMVFTLVWSYRLLAPPWFLEEECTHDF